jgi:thiamine-phosphate pyrophosphorylase
VDFVQIRNHELSARDLCGLVRSVVGLGPRVLVNDRADVAIACGADGVHLRDGSIAPSKIRSMGDLVISVACHDGESVRRAEEEGADYAILAPVFRPLSKTDDREPLGIEALRRIAKSVKIPVIALGGITEANAVQCMEAGAAGVAGITLFSI